MLRLRRTSLTALLLVAVTVLTACGAQDPRPAPPPRPSSTPTPSPTAPTMPALARQKTDAGAKAFVRYYIELINKGGTTGELAAMRRASTRQCKSCSYFIQNTSRMYGAGGSMRGGTFTPDRIWTAKSGRTMNTRTVYAHVTFGAQTYRKSSTARLIHYKAGDNLLTFTLAYSDGWRTAEWLSAK